MIANATPPKPARNTMMAQEQKKVVPGFLVLIAVRDAASHLLRLSEHSPVEKSGIPRDIWGTNISEAAAVSRNRIAELEGRVGEWYAGEDLKCDAVSLLDSLAALGDSLAAGGNFPGSLTEYQLVGAIIGTANALAAVAERADRIRHSQGTVQRD